VINRIAAVLLLLVPVPAGAVSLTLGCSGTFTITHVPKIGVAGDPEKENIKDFSVVVDFDKKAVTGFWSDLSGISNLLPIIASDPNKITFSAAKKFGAVSENIGVMSEKWIDGTVDRITGATQATDTTLYSSGSSTVMTYDLQCKPTRPLF
jgi:hypothetical protein